MSAGVGNGSVGGQAGDEPHGRSGAHVRAVVAYASRDGHAAAIAARIEALLAERRIETCSLDLEASSAPATMVAEADLVVVIAAVRYGRHLPAADTFLQGWHDGPSRPPLALASVNLTARKPNKRTLETNPYLKKLIAKHGLRPVAAAVFAGRLDYPRYRWRDRQMIRLIMALTGGPTDPKTCIDYTDWSAVDAFADGLAAKAASAAA